MPSPNSHTIFDQLYIRMETTLSLKSRHSSGCHAKCGRIRTLIHSPSCDSFTIQQITCQYLNYMTLSAFLEAFKITETLLNKIFNFILKNIIWFTF